MDAGEDWRGGSKIRDMSQELVIWVDEQGAVLGNVLRTVAHDKSNLLIHRETMELLYTNPEHTKFLLQKRSQKKYQYPGYWTMSVTCHVNPEDVIETDPLGYLTAGVREGWEELGVHVTNQRLVGTLIVESDINRAMMGIVVGETTDETTVDPEEVSEVREFDLATIKEVRDRLTPGALKCLTYLGIFSEE